MFGPLGFAFKALSWKAKLGAIAGFLLLLAAVGGGAYFIGNYTGTTKAKAECALTISKFEKEKSDLQSQLNKKQTEIVERVVTQYKDRIITNTRKEIEYVQTAINSVPPQFMLSNGWVRLHDDIVAGRDVSDPSRYADGTSSGIAANEALVVVTRNYVGVCKANAEQLTALQNWVRETQAAVEQANREAEAARKRK